MPDTDLYEYIHNSGTNIDDGSKTIPTNLFKVLPFITSIKLCTELQSSAGEGMNLLFGDNQSRIRKWPLGPLQNAGFVCQSK